MTPLTFFRSILIVLAVLFSHSLYAQSEGFVFVTKPQLISPNEVSKEITIQHQNAGGVAENISETFDLVLSSSSKTGVFVSSSGKSVSSVMSKNTSSRHFFYKDSVLGRYTISVKLTGRETKKSFNLTQEIIVGEKSVSVPSVKTETKTITLNNQAKEIVINQSEEVSVPETKASNPVEPNTTVVFQVTNEKGFWSHLLAWPIRISDFIIRLFYAD